MMVWGGYVKIGIISLTHTIDTISRGGGSILPSPKLCQFQTVLLGKSVVVTVVGMILAVVSSDMLSLSALANLIPS